jgi:hypothetical protein
MMVIASILIFANPGNPPGFFFQYRQIDNSNRQMWTSGVHVFVRGVRLVRRVLLYALRLRRRLAR